MARDVYVLGGYQTDFGRNWTKENKHFSPLGEIKGDAISWRYDFDTTMNHHTRARGITELKGLGM